MFSNILKAAEGMSGELFTARAARTVAKPVLEKAVQAVKPVAEEVIPPWMDRESWSAMPEVIRNYEQKVFARATPEQVAERIDYRRRIAVHQEELATRNADEIARLRGDPVAEYEERQNLYRSLRQLGGDEQTRRAEINMRLHGPQREDTMPEGLIPEHQRLVDRDREAQQSALNVFEQRGLAADEVARGKGYLKEVDLPTRISAVVAEKFPGGKQTPEYVNNWVSKQGLKPKEVEWSGIQELTEQKSLSGETITKADLVDHLEKSKIRLEQRIYKPFPVESIPNKDQNLFGTANYQRGDLPGPAENYQELTVSAPDIPGKRFEGGHYGDKQYNVVGYARLDERISKDGEKTGFVHNLQSDWEGSVKRHGEEGKLESNMKIAPNPDPSTQAYPFIAYNRRADGAWEEIDSGTKEYLMEKHGGDTPKFPFKGVWDQIVLKALVKEGIEKDWKRVAWTTGQEVADRYGVEGASNWAVNLYNKQLPQTVERLFGKYGVKVEKKIYDTHQSGKGRTVVMHEQISWDDLSKLDLTKTQRIDLKTYKSRSDPRNNPGIQNAQEFNPTVFMEKHLTDAQVEQLGGKTTVMRHDKRYDSFEITPQLKEAFKKGKIFMWGLTGAAVAPALSKDKE